MDFLGNQTRTNFLGKRIGDGFSWESNDDEFSHKSNGGRISLGIKQGFCKEKKQGAKKKKKNFLVFLGGFAWIFSEIKRG